MKEKPKMTSLFDRARTLLYALLVCTSASVATEAHADPDFIGFDAEYTPNDQNNYVITVYAVFDNADAVVGNVFNSEIAVSTSGFIHNDIQVGAGGTWVPSASLDIPGFSDSSNDSYVTIRSQARPPYFQKESAALPERSPRPKPRFHLGVSPPNR